MQIMKTRGGGMVVQTEPCFECGEVSLVDVPVTLVANFFSWHKREMFIQDAFPDWSCDQRELIKTGTHPACWDKMFADEPEYDGDDYPSFEG